MWIQFPWLALKSAVDVTPTGNDADSARSLTDSLNPIMTNSMDESERRNSFRTQDTKRNRLWEVKKLDPSYNVLVPSKNRRLAAIKTSLAPSSSDSLASLNVMFQRLHEETIKTAALHQQQLASDSLNAARVQGLDVGMDSALLPRSLGNSSKYRRTLAEDVSVNFAVLYYFLLSL